MSDSSSSGVVVTALRKEFHRRGSAQTFVAVDDVSFTVPPGGALAIVGESGSGKTTVARMVVGLETPTSGSIAVGGADRTRPARSRADRRARGREVQIVFQDPYTSLDRRQTAQGCIGEVLRLHFGLRGSELDDRTEHLASLVGLDGRMLRSRPRALSGGQRQRVAIARALAAEPSVLILDESVAALDVSIQAQVLNLLADIRASTGISYLFISHDLAAVRQVTDDAVVMRAGRIVEAGPVGRVLEAPEDEYTRLLLASVPRPGWRPLIRAERLRLLREGS
jgi:ABC-type glutathione transport system ATPase component